VSVNETVHRLLLVLDRILTPQQGRTKE